MVLPLLNGLDHIAVLRERFAAGSVLAGSIRVEADRPQPGVVVHTSPFLLVSMASARARRRGRRCRRSRTRSRRRGCRCACSDSEAEVMWSKLVRLNALACTTSAYDELLGEIRSTPQLRADLVGAIEEGCAVGRAEGAHDVDPARAIAELEAHDTLGSSMQRDIAAGRAPELDAIPGSVLRAGARHGIRCPTIERLVAMIAARGRRPGASVAPLAAGRRRGLTGACDCSSNGERPGRERGDRLRGDRLDGLLLGLGQLLLVLAVAEHAEVAGDAAVGVDRDAREDLLALVEAEALHVEVREADAVGGVRRVLAVVRGHRLREALEVLGDLAGVRHRFGEGSASVVDREDRLGAMAGAQPVETLPVRPGAGADAVPDHGDGAVIRTVELTKVYAGTDFAAVDRLNLSVHAGEIFGLLGPNGAGKTTTAGMLTTRVIPTSGSAYVGAIDVVAHPALAKQLIGIVSQQNTLDRQLTVWENLYFHGRLFGISAAESRRTADGCSSSSSWPSGPRRRCSRSPAGWPSG